MVVEATSNGWVVTPLRGNSNDTNGLMERDYASKQTAKNTAAVLPDPDSRKHKRKRTASTSSAASRDIQVPPGQAFNAWITNFDSVSRWFIELEKKHNLSSLMLGENGLTKISGFLPKRIAEDGLRLLQSMPESLWQDTYAERNYKMNNINHQFQSSKGSTASGEILGQRLSNFLRIFAAVFPDRLSSFSAGRYTDGDHIEPHSDEAEAKFVMSDGSLQMCSRELAIVYYLTDDWKESYGGSFLDYGPGNESTNKCDSDTVKRYVPEFNSAVIFRIPRMHAVEAVKGERSRFSVYGWYHKDPMMTKSSR